MALAVGEKTVRIPWAAYFGDIELELTFPAEWDVTVYPPADGPDIGEEGIAQAFAGPIGTPRLAELARGRRSAVIVVDDLSRPTPAHRLVPRILAELEAGGVSRDRTLILMGVANHRPLTREDMVKKLGEEVVSSVRVKNHFSWAHCEYIGTTSRGTPVALNKDFLAADLKILVGSIVPHCKPGFAGGAKLVLPGVASIDTAYAWHGPNGPPGGLMKVETEARLDAEEAARMAGVDAIVNVIPNSRRGIAGLVVGDLVAAHRAGVAIAQRVFATQVPAGVDIGVFTAYPKDTEYCQLSLAFNVWWSAPEPIVHEHGTIVACTAASEGPGFHSLMGPGMRLGGEWGAMRNLRRPFMPRQMVVFAHGICEHDLSPEARAEMTLCRTWAHALARLRELHGTYARVAVFPCSAIQLAG